jgi:hypothetical protein
MKRRTSPEFDSLELLLDTICNTFGGILFLAVLVIILVHRAGDSLDREATAQSDLPVASTLPRDLEQRKAELQSLERAFQEYRTTLAGLEAEQAATQARRVLNLRHEVADVTSRRVEYLQRIANLNEEISESEQQRQSISSGLALARKDAQSLKEQLASERRNRTRTVNLPMLRQTAKREFPLILRFGHLYFPFAAETGLATRKSNLDDFVILDDIGPVIRVTPKPYAGLPVNDRDQLLDLLRRRINSLDNGSVYLGIGVWEDSFDQFQLLKEVIVKLGYEYRLVPTAAGEFIQESSVKETLVQ